MTAMQISDWRIEWKMKFPVFLSIACKNNNYSQPSLQDVFRRLSMNDNNRYNNHQSHLNIEISQIFFFTQNSFQLITIPLFKVKIDFFSSDFRIKPIFLSPGSFIEEASSSFPLFLLSFFFLSFFSAKNIRELLFRFAKKKKINRF